MAPKCALPDHLKDRKHNDWVWPFNLIDRAWNAFGPRCGEDQDGYLPWPPILIQGHGVTRWETDGAESIIEIPYLENITVWGSDIYGKTFRAIETNPNNKFFNTELDIELEYREGMYRKVYSPSAIQQFSPYGWMKLYPSFYSCWRRINDKYTFNYSHGLRPDHVDVYFNRRILFVGLKFE